MRLVMRVLVLIALPGLVFSWMPGAVRTAFLRECGAVAALAVVAFLIVRVTAPYFQAALPARTHRFR